VFASLYIKGGLRLLEHLSNKRIGGEKASRKCPRCHSKKIRKDELREKSQLDRKPLSWRKHLSSGSAFILHGISRIVKNRLKVLTTGDISMSAWVQIPLVLQNGFTIRFLGSLQKHLFY
jgi:hypothetical protein